MRRSEMVKILEEEFKDTDINADTFLSNLEVVYGMRPPRLPEEYCQAIMRVYCAGYTLHQWEEEIEKDEKVMESLKRRRELDAMTPEQRKELRRQSRERRSRI